MSDSGAKPRPVGHPLAGEKMSGARMIMQVLADEGVTAIFGYSGGAILPTYDAVFLYNEECARTGRPQIPLIVPANEQGAGFMAAGYARASGRVGLCLVTSGPGATNTVTPVRDCMADSIPIVVISGQVPTPAIGTDAFQEAPVPSIMGSVAKHIFLVTDPAKLESTVRTAFEIARTGRPGPVVVDIPTDVQNWEGDFLIAVGSRFDDRVAGVPAKFARNARRIAHLDVDRAEVNKVKRVHWSHVGLVGEALRSLTAYGLKTRFGRDFSPWLAELAELKRVHAMNYDRASSLIQPGYVIEELNRHARGAAIITTGVGQHQMWAAQYCDFTRPRLWLTSGSMGTMGFGLPAAIGAQIACPDRLVIDIDGDSSIRM